MSDLTDNSMTREAAFSLTDEQLRAGGFVEVRLRDDDFLSVPRAHNAPEDNALSTPGKIDHVLASMEARYIQNHGQGRAEQARRQFQDNYSDVTRRVLEFFRVQPTASIAADAFQTITPQRDDVPLYGGKASAGRINQVIKKVYISLADPQGPRFAVQLESENGIPTAPYGFTWEMRRKIAAKDLVPPFDYTLPENVADQRFILSGVQYGVGTSGAYFPPTAVTLIDSPIQEDGSMVGKVRFAFTQDLLEKDAVDVYWMWTHHVRAPLDEEQYRQSLSTSLESARDQLEWYYERTVRAPRRWDDAKRLARLSDRRSSVGRLCGAVAALAKPRNLLNGPKLKALPAN